VFLLCRPSSPVINMYGAMGSGGGNAWMKIMGIDQDKLKSRNLGKEKIDRDAKTSGGLGIVPPG